MLDVATTGAMITTAITDIGDVLVIGLGAVLGLLGVLIGLFFVLRFITKKIGRAR